MTSINISYSAGAWPASRASTPLSLDHRANLTGTKAVTDAAEPTISTLASRLARAAQDFSGQIGGMSRKELAAKVQGNIDAVLYTLDEAHKATAAKEVPQPNDAQSAASAAAATAYVNDDSQPNPFAGLSREQLATIANDDSGAFTINERRSAFMQAYNEEQAWRTKVIEKAQHEHEQTGKLTNFFKMVREHFDGLPLTEQVLYPANYAADLTSKINLNSDYALSAPATSRPGVLDLAAFLG